jgi:hypothetical protein
VPGLIAGALLRAVALPRPGTEDVVAMKIWTHAAAHDPTSMYGVGGSPPERRVLHWNGHENSTNYPPLAMYELGASGRLYGLLSPAFEDSATLTMAVKLPGLIADIAFVVALFKWGRRFASADAVAAMVLIFWLNPAALTNGTLLGYLDPAMAIPAALSLVAAFVGAPWVAGILLAVSILTKPNPVYVAPVIAAVVLRGITTGAASSAIRALVRFAAGGVAASVAIVAPVVLRGGWTNLVQALGRLVATDVLSGQAANFWWLFTYVVRVMDVWAEWGPRAAILMRVRILAVTRAVALGYPNPYVVGFVLVGTCVALATWRTWKSRSLAIAAAAAGWAGWAYSLFATLVHENHMYMAIPFLCIAAGLDRRFRAMCWTASIVSAINMYLFGGFGLDVPPIDRSITWLDASVVLAVVNLAAFLWFGWKLVRSADMPSASAWRFAWPSVDASPTSSH